MYSLIKTKFKEIKVPYSLFYKVLKIYLKIVVIKLFEGKAIQLPAKLGMFYIFKKKTGMEFDANDNIVKRVFYIDLQRTKEMKGKKIYNMNIDYIMRMKWKKDNFKNKSLFFLSPNKEIKKMLWDIANTNNLLIIKKYRDGK
jgi:hypothetical protein